MSPLTILVTLASLAFVFSASIEDNYLEEERIIESGEENITEEVEDFCANDLVCLSCLELPSCVFYIAFDRYPLSKANPVVTTCLHVNDTLPSYYYLVSSYHKQLDCAAGPLVHAPVPTAPVPSVSVPTVLEDPSENNETTTTPIPPNVYTTNASLGYAGMFLVRLLNDKELLVLGGIMLAVGTAIGTALTIMFACCCCVCKTKVTAHYQDASSEFYVNLPRRQKFEEVYDSSPVPPPPPPPPESH